MKTHLSTQGQCGVAYNFPKGPVTGWCSVYYVIIFIKEFENIHISDHFVCKKRIRKYAEIIISSDKCSEVKENNEMIKELFFEFELELWVPNLMIAISLAQPPSYHPAHPAKHTHTETYTHSLLHKQTWFCSHSSKWQNPSEEAESTFSSRGAM